MGSSWRYPPCHNNALLHRVRAREKCTSEPMKNIRAKGFSRARSCIFHRLAHKYVFHGSHRSKQKNKLAHLAHFTFSQHLPTQVSPLYPQLDPIYYGVDRYYFCIESIEKKVLSTWITFIFSFIRYCQGKRTLKITITFNISITFNKSVNMYKCSKGIINIEICTRYLSNETVLNLSINRGE